MLRQRVYNVEHAFQVALDMEEYLRYPITTKFGSQAKEAEFKISVEANMVLRLHCHNCLIR
jgi:hypothetical protein